MELCNAFTKAPVLAHFDPATPILRKMGASGFAIAGIISQQQDEVHGSTEVTAHGMKGQKSVGKGYWHLVAFWSCSMSPAEQNYAVGDQDMLAIIMTCRYWCHYL
jgi:hypothetical protein